MAGGHVTTYSKEYKDRALEYIEKCKDEIEEFHKTRGTTSDSYERIVKVKLPSVSGLAVYLKVARSTVYKWADDIQEFSDILEELLALQEERLLDSGLSGDYNPTIVKLVLSKHGYREGIDHSTNGKDMPTPILGSYVPTNNSTE